jgi:Glycosyltransferase 61
MERMFLSCFSSKASWPIKSSWAILGISALFLLNLQYLNQLFDVKKQIDLGMQRQIIEKPMPPDKVPETVSTPMAMTHETEATLSPSTDVGKMMPLPVLLQPDDPKRMNETTPTAWCILDRNNTNPHFRHFPHALQSLAPCWSFFCRVRKERGTEVPCGIYIHYPPRVPWKDMSSWTRQLVEYMGCQVVVQGSQENTPIGSVIVEGDVQYRVPNQHVPNCRLFEKTEHVHQLQARVLGNEVVTNPEMKQGGIRIGLLQRIRDNPKRPSRIFLNLDTIRSRLQAAFPDATLVETDMRQFSLREQALWWHQNDVVLAAHGAAIANCIFLRSHNGSTATVIEVFPDGFHPTMFGALMRSVGVRRLTIDHNASISVGKNADLQPNPTLVVQLVRQALRVNNLHMDRELF